MSKPLRVVVLGMLIVSAIGLAGCGKPSPNQPKFIGQMQR